MVMLATLRRSGGINALSRHLNLSPADGAAAARDLLDQVVGLYRDRFERSGGGKAGVAALKGLLDPFGGGRMAMEILSSEPLAEGKPGQVLATLLPTDDAIQALIGKARNHSLLPADQLVAVLPILVMLVGGYLAARVETSAESGEDIVTEFEQLFQREAPRPGAV